MRRFYGVLLLCVALGCSRQSSAVVGVVEEASVKPSQATAGGERKAEGAIAVKSVQAEQKQAPPVVVAEKERHPLIGVWCPWRVKEKEFGLPRRITAPQQKGETKEQYERRKKNDTEEEAREDRGRERVGFSDTYRYFLPNGVYQLGTSALHQEEWLDLGAGLVCLCPPPFRRTPGVNMQMIRPIEIYRWKVEGDILTLTTPAEPRPGGKWSDETAQTYKRLH